jgi:hypothetical protein
VPVRQNSLSVLTHALSDAGAMSVERF